MGFWNRIKERRALDAAAEPNDAQAAALLSAFVGTGDIDARTALEIPAFSASVDFIADTVAMLPIKLYREQPGEKAEELAEDNRVLLLNGDTGDLFGAVEARKAQVRDMLLHGAGYIYINRGAGGGVSSLHYVRAENVSAQVNPDPIFKKADLMVNGQRYYPWDFIVLARNSEDGVTGKSIVDDHMTILSAAYNTLKYENVISKTGGNKKGFLRSERTLSNDKIRELRTAWEDLYANNGNNMMVLNSGLEYVPSASTSVEMQMNQNKLTNAEQIAQMFRLSADVLSGRANTQQYMSAIRTAIMPIITAYQEALNRSLLLESEKRTMYFAFDTTELMKGDTLSRYQAYEVALRNNFLQIDEVRYLEDRAPLGFNYIKLGLQDVLLDPNTGDVYTPNTNAAVNLSKMGQFGGEGLTDGEEGGIIEERARHYIRGEHGYFMGSVSDGNSGGGGKQPYKKSQKMGEKECVRLSHQIATDFPALPAGNKPYPYENRNHFYIFSVNGFGSYQFYYKIPIDGNEDYIREIRKGLKLTYG